jgi:hypothetical protein
MTKTKKSATKAKRKPSAYNNFVKNKMKNRGNKAVTVMMKSIGAEWRKLSDAEKKKWA